MNESKKKAGVIKAKEEIGDGISIKCIDWPDGLITKMYLAILDGRLKLKDKNDPR